MIPHPRTVLVLLFATLTSGCQAETACQEAEPRPYGKNAPWNVPVAKLPRHPRSDEYVHRLWEKGSNRPGNFNLVFDEYTYPVYYKKDATGLYPVVTKWKTDLTGQKIPWNPDWKAPSGSDAQIIILDPEEGTEWNLWQVEFDGQTVKATNGSRVPQSYWTREVGFIPSRGAGIPYLAMLVRGYELKEGAINHALTMGVKNPDGYEFFAPATKIEYKGLHKNGIPEGIRFALDVSDEEIETWINELPGELPDKTRRSARVIARALRDYGWFVVDNAGVATMQFESRLTAEECWKEAGLDYVEIDYKEFPRDLLDGLMTRERIYTLVPSDAYPDHLKARPGRIRRLVEPKD